MTLTLTNLGSLLADLNYRWRDFNAANPKIPLANKYSWINRAIWFIEQDLEFVEASSYLTGNGINNEFTLVGGVAGTNVGADYLGMAGIYVDGVPVDGPVDRATMRKWNDDLSTGTPTYYGLYAGKVIFDYIPTDDLHIDVDYYGCSTALSGLLDAPPFPLSLNPSLILARVEVEKSGDDGNPAGIQVAEQIYKELRAQFVNTIENKGKHQSLGSVIPRRHL